MQWVFDVRENVSIQSFNGNGLGMEFLNDDLLTLVEKYSSKGIIPDEELNEEIAIRLEFLKLAIPVKGSEKSLAWTAREFGSEMEIPYVVRFYFLNGKNWRKAIEEYFKVIGERNPGEFIEIFREIVNRAKNLIICAEDIVDIAMRHKKEPGALISELKGSGLISPSMGCGGLGNVKAPLYEINRFFAILLKIED